MLNKREYRLDILKAVAIIMVLILHLKPIIIGSDGTPTLTVRVSQFILSAIYSVTKLGVPIFYFVALFLFFKKNKNSNQYFSRRIKRLINIFSFWFIIQLSFYFIFKYVAIFSGHSIAFSPINLKLWWKLIMMGGPSLPGINGSVFYFLFDLICLIFLSFYYDKFSTRKIDILFFIIFSLYLFLHQYIYGIQYWRIDNFLIYIPIAHFFSSKQNNKFLSKKYLYLSFFIYISFFIYEKLMGRNFFNVIKHLDYDVNSLQWGVIFLYLLITLYNFHKNNNIVWLSKHSLGLYATHKYFKLILMLIFSSLLPKGPLKLTIGSGEIYFFNILVFFCTISLCILTIRLVRLVKPLKKYFF